MSSRTKPNDAEWAIAIDEMRRACVALYSEVPKTVADDVNRRWDNVMGAYTRRHLLHAEQPEGEHVESD